MKEYLKKRLALTDQGSKDLIKASILCFLTFFVNMFPAMFLMFFLDGLIADNLQNSIVYCLIGIIIFVVMFFFLSKEYNALYNGTYKESENLRIDIARRLRELPLSYFSKHDLSDLAQTIMSDVAGIEHALSHTVAKCMGFIGFFIIMIILLIGSNLKLGLCVVIPILSYFAIMFLSKKLQVKGNLKYYKKLRANSESFQEAIELQQEIKSFGLSDEIKDKLNKEVEEGEKVHFSAEIAGALVSSISSIILYLPLVLIVILGSNMLLSKEINILYFIGYFIVAIKIKELTEGIGLNIVELFYIDAMINRINEIRDFKTQEGEDSEISNYDIELKNVSFSYDENTKVLDDITFTAKQNEVTALVGKSGCGKTSILRLVSRLYDYDNGSINISGKDIKTISTKSLFEKISIVFQDVTLFNTSILENIRIGNINATDEEIKKAAKLANCEEFIEKLPNGYDTFIGENGVSLSGGERQRLSIARAFLKNAPIIILDEISASLDVDNENKIQESLNKLINNKTVLIISHRLKSIENVDKIVVIDNGKVESEGTHEELIYKSKIYKDLMEKTSLAEKFEY
ncbi:ABC transporter ATP-binding protein [Peptacetobacter sp.]|uniref:ABC transporter ATP-binding protein n=1 Tax=Peptacetobacter sp. TaxID=2991975 RepID=UPI0026045670|nr:ABC transporter ATP-binding protein [Peptacetobacter sp.]